MDGPHLQALQEALQRLGNSQRRLADALGIRREDLEAYLAGKEVPHQVFLGALDIITGR